MAIGRVLPVFLAILFVGGPDQIITPPHASIDYPRLHGSKSAPARLSAANARTALCLLPALLTQAFQTDPDHRYASASSAQRIVASLVRSRFVSGSSTLANSPLFIAAELWQRPPPRV